MIQKENEEKLLKYNQNHILELLSNLNSKEKQALEEQILNLDFDHIFKLYSQTKIKKEINIQEISPIKYVDKERIENKEKERIQKIGEQIIKNNQYAVITMAGGQGTRLGFNGPKGTFQLDFGEYKKYIFEILAENLKKSKILYGVLPYWYIMTSEENNLETITFFENNKYFGYEKEKVRFFKQGILPVLTKEGNLVIENNKIKTASNGNGGIYRALKNENIIEDMKKKNIKNIYVCGVDNIMVNPIDTLFIGLAQENKAEISSKSVAKKYPEEKVGVFCKKNNKPSIVEYIELSENMRNMKNNIGELAYGEANIVSHLFTIDAIEKLSDVELNYHLAIKNNMYKFETFIFDGFEQFNDMFVMRVKRENEFAPIKNKEGIDSPETAKEIYLSFQERNK